MLIFFKPVGCGHMLIIRYLYSCSGPIKSHWFDQYCINVEKIVSSLMTLD